MIAEALQQLRSELPATVKLLAVSKFQPLEALQEAYAAGQRRFGENRPQELAAKAPVLPGDIEWHFIGHLQTNKLKMVLPYAAIVESVDTLHLLEAIDAWGKANDKVIPVLLELHIGAEQTKQGFYEEDLDLLFNAEKYAHVRFCGLMGMASHTDEEDTVRADFTRIATFLRYLQDLFPELEEFRELSIGMSEDWRIAVECGSTEVRIGSAIFGPRA